uniref:Uncharacterized protein n=1 Tax=Arundo donax TaxID=35708 RepID=A0A0A8ZWL6_ARUDO
MLHSFLLILLLNPCWRYLIPLKLTTVFQHILEFVHCNYSRTLVGLPLLA